MTGSRSDEPRSEDATYYSFPLPNETVSYSSEENGVYIKTNDIHIAERLKHEINRYQLDRYWSYEDMPLMFGIKKPKYQTEIIDTNKVKVRCTGTFEDMKVVIDFLKEKNFISEEKRKQLRKEVQPIMREKKLLP